MSENSNPLHRHTNKTTESISDCLAGQWPELVAMLTRKGWRPEDAQDAAQEAILAALIYLRSRRFQEIKDPRKWLRAVSIFAVRKSVRRRFAFDPESLANFSVEPTDEVERGDEVLHLLATVHQLPPELSVLVEFCYLQGNTYEAAAEHFGLPAGTVGGRLEKARRLLRELLRPTLP